MYNVLCRATASDPVDPSCHLCLEVGRLTGFIGVFFGGKRLVSRRVLQRQTILYYRVEKWRPGPLVVALCPFHPIVTTLGPLLVDQSPALPLGLAAERRYRIT